MILKETAVSDDHALDLLMAYAEGLVRANIVTIELDPESYPCCCGCGGYELDYFAPTSPRRAVAHFAAKGAQEVRMSHRGTAFELAAYQCAQRRREGEENAWVQVTQEPQSRELVCVVLRPDKGDESSEDMRKFAPARNCSGEQCDCEA